MKKLFVFVFMSIFIFWAGQALAAVSWPVQGSVTYSGAHSGTIKVSFHASPDQSPEDVITIPGVAGPGVYPFSGLVQQGTYYVYAFLAIGDHPDEPRPEDPLAAYAGNPVSVNTGLPDIDIFLDDPNPIPTVGVCGAIALFIMLAVSGWLMVRKRRQTR